MKKLINVVDASEHRVEVEKRVKNTVKRGKVHSETIRTDKIVEFSFFVEIEARDGITHALERRRVRDALRAKMSGDFNDLRRRADGTYIFNEPKIVTTVDPRIRDFAEGMTIVDARSPNREDPKEDRQRVRPSPETPTTIYEFVTDERAYRFTSESLANANSRGKTYHGKPVIVRPIIVSSRLVSTLKNEGKLAA